MKRIILSRNFEEKALFRNIIKPLKEDLKMEYISKMSVTESNSQMLRENKWFTVGNDSILIDIPESVALKIPISSLLNICDKEPANILAHSRNIENRPTLKESGCLEMFDDDKVVYYFNHANADITCIFKMDKLPLDHFEDVFDAFFIIEKYYKSDNVAENDKMLIEKLKELSQLKPYVDEFTNQYSDDVKARLIHFFTNLADEYTVSTN